MENKEYRVIVNGVEIGLSDPVPNAAQILSQAGMDPANEYILIRLLPHESRSISLDELLELPESQIAHFRAFRSDRIFRFTIDSRGYEWGNAQISEAELRQLAGVSKDKILILQREGADQDLDPDDCLDLGNLGTEHLLTEKKSVEVWLDGDKKSIPRGVYDTEELIQALGVEPGYRLNLLKDGSLMLLEPGERLRVKENMHFISQVPCGGAA